jgi:hypothetical protein
MRVLSTLANILSPIADAWYNGVFLTSASARQVVFVAEFVTGSGYVAIDNVDFSTACGDGAYTNAFKRS